MKNIRKSGILLVILFGASASLCFSAQANTLKSEKPSATKKDEIPPLPCPKPRPPKPALTS